jgi:hypothetical protein
MSNSKENILDKHIGGSSGAHNLDEYSWILPAMQEYLDAHIEKYPIIIKRTRKLKRGDFFFWVSGSGKFEIHQFHSDAGYGVKTFTDYEEKDGSSLLVNWSGVYGKIEPLQKNIVL